jgi:hypothetical protein
MAALLREWYLVQVAKRNPLTTSITSLADSALSYLPRDTLQGMATQADEVGADYRMVSFNFAAMHQYWVVVPPCDPFGTAEWIGPNMLAVARMAQRARIHVRSPGVLRLALAFVYVVDLARGTRDAGSDVHRVMRLRPPPRTFDEVQAFDVPDSIYPSPTQRAVRNKARANAQLAIERAEARAASAPGQPLPPITSKELVAFTEQGKPVRDVRKEHPVMFGVHCVVGCTTSSHYGTFALAPPVERLSAGRGLGKPLRFKTDFMAALVREYLELPLRSNFVKQPWVVHNSSEEGRCWAGPPVTFLRRYELAHAENMVTMDNYAAISDMATQGQLLPPRLPGATPAVLPEWPNHTAYEAAVQCSQSEAQAPLHQAAQWQEPAVDTPTGVPDSSSAASGLF